PRLPRSASDRTMSSSGEESPASVPFRRHCCLTALRLAGETAVKGRGFPRHFYPPQKNFGCFGKNGVFQQARLLTTIISGLPPLRWPAPSIVGRLRPSRVAR